MSYNSPFTGNVVQPTDVSYRAITLSVDLQLQWPINGSATDDYAARIMDVTAPFSPLSLRMPPANQTSVGTDALIRNVGATSFTVKDYAGINTIITINPGEAKYIYITDNPDEQGTWGIISFGVGTSSADAATLAGYGLLAQNATLNQSHPAVSLVNGYFFLSGDRASAYVWSGGSGSATLPLAANFGNNWFVLFKNSGTGTFTINTSGGETIDNSLTKNFAPEESCIIICTGTSWITVGYGQSSQFEFTALTKAVTGGAYTLTASEASNNIQTYTGSLVSNVTVTYPPVVNLYVVSNQTSGAGYTITLTTGVAGGATAVIPASGTATVFCDGTNFRNANTTQAGASSLSIINGLVGSPAINFSAETSTGIYRPGAGRFGISVLGSLIADFTATGLAVTGTGNFTAGVSGGTF